jgi:hypothetical protein
MATNSALVASIVANPSVHQVNREYKMHATMDVMICNHEKKEAHRTGLAIERGNLRGYGKGKNQGD